MKTTEPVHELLLNYACTAKCPFCYNPPLTPELLRRDLSFDQAVRSLYAAAKSGARLLNLHGGEVTLRDDLPKLLALARKLGFAQITVVTNGVRLGHADYADALVAAGATHFRLSIHAASPAIHDELLAIPGAFARAAAALSHLRRRGVPVGLNYVLVRRNLSELPAFVRRFCLEEGVDDVIVYFPHLRGMMAVNEGQAPSYAEAAAPVREALSLLTRAGRRASVLLANFVPCVLPDLADRLLDWAREPGEEASMAHPEGFTEDILAMKDEQRVAVSACGVCALKSRCRGVERDYLSRRGETEFSPLASAETAA